MIGDIYIQNKRGGSNMRNNPIIWADYPDPDIIRVDDTYYMVTTTMHFMPGCVIMRSYDLINWEVATYVYETLDDTQDQKLEGEKHIYGKGMWAASLRYHKGRFYVCFVANDTQKTYLFTATDIAGSWKKQIIEGFYHDCSLLFDDDDRIYIVYGNTEIHLTELNEELSAPKQSGINRIILRETQEFYLGYEGAHFYKINGKYYVFFIHISKSGHNRRTQACFVADYLDGEFVGGEVFDDDMGYFNSGIAQEELWILQMASGIQYYFKIMALLGAYLFLYHCALKMTFRYLIKKLLNILGFRVHDQIMNISRL